MSTINATTLRTSNSILFMKTNVLLDLFTISFACIVSLVFTILIGLLVKKFQMKEISDKKKLRFEKKKKRIVALSKVMSLNELDRNEKASHSSEPEIKKAKLVQTIKEPLQLTEEQYKELKHELNEKRLHLKNVPKLRLKDVGSEALIKTNPKDRIPLFLEDIQHLLMHTMLRTNSPYTPSRWCILEKSQKLTHIVVLLVEGLISYDFSANESLFVESSNIFESILEIIIPGSLIMEELACVPLTEMHKDILVSEYGTLEAAMHECRDHLLIKKSIFNNIEDDDDAVISGFDKTDLPDGDKYPRTALLLSPVQMVHEDYPLPLIGNLRHRYKDYVMTNDSYKPVSPKSPLFGLDCEMVRTSTGISELARVSIVNEEGENVYETMVCPEGDIIDYLTQYSGITVETLKDVTKTLKEVQQELHNFLPPDAILVGQSLNFDLHSLKMMHPYVIDTSILYNITGDRSSKTKLKFLVKRFLQKDIQMSSEGHSSIEDSMASLELVKLKLKKDIYFGDDVLRNRRNYHQKISKLGIADQCDTKLDSTSETTEEIQTTIFSHVKKLDKKSSIITHEDNHTNFHRYFSNSLKSETDSRVDLINFEKVDTPLDVIEKTTKSCINYDFNLSCIKLDKTKIKGEENLKKTITDVDKLIKTLWDSLSRYGLLVVICGGGEVNGSSNAGVAMLQTKLN